MNNYLLGGYVLTFGLFAAKGLRDIFLLSESHDCDDTTILTASYKLMSLTLYTSGPINEFETLQIIMVQLQLHATHLLMRLE